MTDPWHDLRDRRCRKGMTQMELAYRIVSQAQMSLIEQGVVMPSEKVISRLAVRVGCHPDIWLEAWAPHRTQVNLKRQLWRSFVSNNQMALARLLQPENGPTVLDHACYSQWLHAKDGELDGLHASLQVIRTLVHASDGKYLPLRMKNRGDVRLHIVLALTEAQLCIRLHRHLAATTWHTYARSLMPEIPRFWM